MRRSIPRLLLFSVLLLGSGCLHAGAYPEGGRPASGNGIWSSLGSPLPALDGTRHSLAEWKGRVVLINFWASWCGPCQYEIPELVALQARHAGAGLQIIGIGMDEERPLHNVARSLGINYPVLVADEAGGRRLLKRLGNPRGVIPYSVVINRAGNLVHTHLGQIDEEVFDAYVTPLLEGR